MQSPDMLTELLIIILVVLSLVIIYYFTRVYKKPKGEKGNYVAALEFLADGNEKWAIQKFKEAVREDSENVEAYLRLGDLLRKKGMASNALKIHKDLTLRSNLSEENRTKIKYSLLLDQEELGNYKSAIDTAMSILEVEKKAATDTAVRLLNYLEKEENWSEASEVLGKYFKDSSTQLERRGALYLIFSGLQIQEKGNGREARIKFKEALKFDNQCAAAYYYLGESYQKENRLEDAIREWERLCEIVPQKSHVAFKSLERAWFDLGKFKEAESFYKNFLEKDPNNSFAAIALAEIYNKKEDYDRAMDVLNKFSEQNLDDPDILGYHIKTLINKTNYKQAANLAHDYFLVNYDLEGLLFTCQECQYTAETPLWICPQCKSIDSFLE
jgi:lipopolysaccharide biosynthesis regulator YciM